MNDTAFCLLSCSLFLFFSSVHDLKIRKDFYTHAKEDYQKVIYNIDNEIKMEKLAGEELPAIGEKVFICWTPEDAVLIHSLDNRFYQSMENIKLA